MKYSLLILSLLVVLVEAKSNSYALLIGVGEYPESSGWNSLASNNDLRYIRTALLSIGFNDHNIISLQDDKADRKGILRAMDLMANTVVQGDLLIVHYSGHGQQVIDTDGDEVDGYDEAWVPYDAEKQYVRGLYEGGNHIIDDEVASYDLIFRKRLGARGKLIWVIDACHSGTSTRTYNRYSRGTDVVIGESAVATNLGLEHHFGVVNAKKSSNSIASVACFTASSSSQSNQECKDDIGEPIGSLSYAFAKTITAGYASHNMQDIYNRIKIRMLRNVPLQSPQFEGDGDFVIKERSDTTEVLQLYSITNLINLSCDIDGGFLQGVTLNSKVEIYSLDRKMKLGSGVVTSVDLSTAKIALSDGLNTVGNELLKAKIVRRAQPVPNLVTDYQSRGMHPVIERYFNQVSYNQISDCNADITIVENADSSISLYDRYGMDYLKSHEVLNTPETIRSIERIVRQITFAEYIRDYENDLGDMDLEIQGFDQSGRLIEEGSTLSTGDKVRFELSNNGNRRMYFGFIGVSPNGNTYVIRPGEREYVLDQFVEPGKKIALTKLVGIVPPFGLEVVKVFVSHKPISWIRDVFEELEEKENRSAEFGPFQNVLGVLNNNEIDPRGMNNSSLNTIGAISFHFKIVRH